MPPPNCRASESLKLIWPRAELRKNGARVRLQEQPFQVLQFLLEHQGDIVKREDLRQHLGLPIHS